MQCLKFKALLQLIFRLWRHCKIFFLSARIKGDIYLVCLVFVVKRRESSVNLASDLIKAFDRVPKKVIWWALGSGVEEWDVLFIQGMYEL